MQSEANALAVKFRQEYDLGESGFRAVERVIYAITSTTAYSIDDADVWIGTLLELFRIAQKRKAVADYIYRHTGYNYDNRHVFGVYDGKRKVGEVSSHNNGMWYWVRRATVTEGFYSRDEAVADLAKHDDT